MSGKPYEITLRKMKGRWLDDDELEAAVLRDMEKLRQVLEDPSGLPDFISYGMSVAQT